MFDVYFQESTGASSNRHAHMQHPFHQLDVWLQEGVDLVIRDSCGMCKLYNLHSTMTACSFYTKHFLIQQMHVYHIISFHSTTSTYSFNKPFSLSTSFLHSITMANSLNNKHFLVPQQVFVQTTTSTFSNYNKHLFKLQLVLFLIQLFCLHHQTCVTGI